MRHRLVVAGLAMMIVAFLVEGALRTMKQAPVFGSLRVPAVRRGGAAGAVGSGAARSDAVGSGAAGGGAVDGSEVAALYYFLETMDSLRESASGRSVYDSLCRARPGLQDSVRMAIRIYTFRKYYK